MSDLIDRQAVIDALKEHRNIFCDNTPVTFSTLPYGDKCRVDEIDNAIATLINLPSAQPETAKRIVGKSRDGMTLWYQCNMCNEPVDVQDNFCRGCGRRLE